MPIPIRRVEPKYTPAAMSAYIEGSVDVDLTVQPDGTVGDLRVTRSLDKVLGLDDEAIRAARLWLFQPGMLQGGPRVPVRLTITLYFQLGS
jgi:protein TonB